MKKILIIGGCGYIGSSLYLYLTNKKYIVDTADLEWFGNCVNPKNLKINYRTLSKEFLKRYQVIILLAGYSSVKLCEGNRKKVFKNHVENFVYLLDKITTQKFIYASSSSIYGNTRKTEVSEAYNKYSPMNYYDLSKKEIDYYAQLSNHEYYGLRFGTLSGYSPNLRIDLMINKMYENASRTGEIVIYNPGIHRPILGIMDLNRAVKKIIQDQSNPGVYNIASFNATIKEISRKVAAAMGNVRIKEVKGESLYDFSVSTAKFERAYNFRFKDTVESIVKSLTKVNKNTLKSIREKLR